MVLRELSNGPHEGSANDGLCARGLSVSFPGSAQPALDDIGLVVPAGRVLALLGPSGCGKSTALRVVAGLQEAAGSVQYDGVDVTRVPAHRRGFSLMFQDGQLFGNLSVFENVAYGLRRRRVPKAQVATRVEELLDLVGLTGFGTREPATLSGGQQQRVALARALAPRPRLLLLDEPLSALDRGLRERLAADLSQVIRAEGATAMFVTHDHDEALTVADDVALMRAGRIVQTGAVREVWQAPVDAEAARFLGYTNVLNPDEARRVGLPDGAWATRRTAWQVNSAGTGSQGVITQVSGAGELVHFTVVLDAVPGLEIEAAMLSGERADGLRVGATVTVGVDASRAARLPALGS